jgi:membrane fusion protein (multidrug efflux system)
MRALPVVALWLASALLAGACGKKDEDHGADLRTPPPVPARGGGKPAPAPARSPSPSPAPASAPSSAPAAPAPGPGPAPAAPSLEVKVATPLRKTVQVTADYTGQTIGSETVEVRARVEGYLESIHFTEGTFVQKGDLLYEIDKDKMSQVVEQVQGELNVARADEEKTIADVNRNRPLVEKNAISREEYETSVSAQKAAHAKVEAAEAALARAKINLGYATVRAPIAGLVGKTEVDVGNLVGRGEPTLLTTISKIDPIYAEVRISETDVLEYRRARAEGRRKETGDLALYFSDGSRHPHGGKIAVIDRNIDTKTGTLLVQVSFPNPDNATRPGQFARVQAVRDTLTDALLVPQGSVDELQGTYRLFVVGDGDLVRVKTVTMGPRLGNLWVVSQGLEAGDRVVVEGRQKVRDGTAVKPTPVAIGEDGSLSAGAGGAPPSDAKR